MFNTLVETRHGQMLCNRNDQYVGKSLIKYGEFSPDECSYLLSLLKPGDVVVEVGANIGALTVPIAQKVKRVIAYEPQRLQFQTLCANLALNSIHNVWAWNTGVGKTDSVLAITEHDPRAPRNFGGVSLGHGGSAVPVHRLLDRCTFLKLDCEGMELDVLEGATPMIERHKPVMYLENDREDKREALIRKIEDLGYRWEWHLPPLFSATNYRGNSENLFGDIVSVNMICTPRKA